MMEKDYIWLNFRLQLLQTAYLMKEKREKSFLLDDATKRYQDFLKNFALIEEFIKQYHVASFLGITPVGLSRIKKKLK